MDRRAQNLKCVLKVNIGCCKACVVNLNKLLKKIEGVDAVDIDPKTGLVTVSGKVDPATLVKMIEKKKKKAEVLSYEDPRSTRSSGGNADCSCGVEKQNGADDSDHEFGEAPKEFGEIECKDPYCRLHHTKPIIPRNNGCGHVIKFHHPPPLADRMQYHHPPPPPPDHRQCHPPPPPPQDHMQYPPTPPLYQRYIPQNAFYPSWYRAHLPQSGSYTCYCPRPSPPPAHYGYYGRI